MTKTIPGLVFALSALLLPHQAYLMLDAIVRTIFRKVFSRKKLLEWVTAQHARLRQHGSLIRTCLAEFEEHPELAPVACDGSVSAFADAARYLTAARRRGMLSAEGSIEASTVMLMNAVFMDAITRDVIDGCRPVAVIEALQEFVDLTLRALGAVEDR